MADADDDVDIFGFGSDMGTGAMGSDSDSDSDSGSGSGSGTGTGTGSGSGTGTGTGSRMMLFGEDSDDIFIPLESFDDEDPDEDGLTCTHSPALAGSIADDGPSLQFRSYVSPHRSG
jgi:hypothetical protein